MKTYIELPELPSRHVLNPERGAFSLVVPEATTNLITNPSVETNSTGWTAVVAAIARSTTQQRYGAYSLAITNTTGLNDGAYYGTVSLTSGTTYTASLSVYAPAGMPLRLYFATTAGVALMTTKFIGTGRWKRIAISYTETSTTTRRIYIAKDNSAKTGIVYVDGLQLEAKAYETTYCDGDMQGLVAGQFPTPYIWTGAAHASTSTRSAQTRDGGRVYNLDHYGFRVTGHIGLGYPVPNNTLTPYGQIDGAEYQRTLFAERSFSLSGRVDAGRFAQLARQRSDLVSAMARDNVSIDQPIVLLYEEYDELLPIGDEVKIVALYQGGLENTTNNRHGEDIIISFTMPSPFLTGGAGGAALDGQTTVSDATYLIKRNSAGDWATLFSGMDDQVLDLASLNNTTVYAAGTFLIAGGVAANRIASWNGTVWSALGTGLNGAVYGIALAANGDLYACGAFTTAGGGAANRVARWDGSAWSALGTGLDGDCNDIALAANGDLYAAGAFTTAGGVAANRIAKWNGTVWSALGTGLDGTAQEMSIALNGDLYVGGSFVAAGGVTVNRIAKWNGTAWSSLGSGITGADVITLTTAPDGSVYAAGNFTAAGGVTAANIAKWNGTAWSSLGSGLVIAFSQFVIRARQNGTLFVGASPVDIEPLGNEHASIWTGSSFVLMDINFTAFTTPTAFLETNDGTIYIGSSGSVPTTAPTVVSVTNTGTAKTYPRIKVYGPTSGSARLFQFSNYTTGKALYFNYTMLAGEVLSLDLDPKNISFASTFQGNILRYILGGSNRAEMFLIPGVNLISFFITDDTITTVIEWKQRYNGTDDTVF